MRASSAATRVGAVVVLAAGATTGLLALPASAATTETATPSPVTTNWYWSQAAPSANGTALPAGPPAAASGVPAGDLGVGYAGAQNGDPDKLAAVNFSLSQIPLGSTFSSFLVTVPLDADANQLKNGIPALSACENMDAFAGGAGPTAMSQAPPVSAGSCVKGEFKATLGKGGGYVFDLTAMANDWSGGASADGITLQPTPDVASPEPFTLSLQGKKGITSEAAYTPSDTPVAAPGSGTFVPGSGAVPTDLAGVAAAPAVPELGAAAPPTVSQAAPQIPAPQVNPAPQAVSAASSTYTPGALTPPTSWWLALLAVAGLLGLTSVVLADPMAPVAVDGRRRRFARVVRSRSQVSPPSRSVASATHFRPA